MKGCNEMTLKELGLQDYRFTIKDEQKANILDLRASGVSYRKIAEQVGVSYVSVYAICNPKYRETIRKQVRKSSNKFFAKNRIDRVEVSEKARQRYFRKKLAYLNKNPQD